MIRKRHKGRLSLLFSGCCALIVLLKCECNNTDEKSHEKRHGAVIGLFFPSRVNFSVLTMTTYKMYLHNVLNKNIVQLYFWYTKFVYLKSTKSKQQLF